MNKILYIAHGNYNLLSRAKNHIGSLLANKYEVTIINGLFEGDKKYHQDLPIQKIRIGTSRFRVMNYFFVLVYYFKVFLVARKLKFEIVICRELTNLPAGVLIKCFKNIRLIYDSNELSVETHKGLSKKIWGLTERWCLSCCDEIIHANNERKEYFLQKYSSHTLPQKNHTIENYPVYRAEKIKIRDESIVKAVYFGSLDLDRGLLELLKSIKSIDNFQLDLIGFGGKVYLDNINKLIKDYDITNVRILEPIDDADAVREFQKYQIGLAFYPNVNLNNWFCAPNKIWQYIHARLAILTTANPPILKEVDKYGFGVCIKSINEVNLSEALEKIVKNKMWEQITEEIIKEHSWQFLEEKYINIIGGKSKCAE